MTYRVIIADDEMLARKRLRMMLETKPEYAIVAECGDGPETVEAIVQHEPNLLFLDIKVPALDGFDVLEALDAARVPPAVVFVTAFDAYAVKAFDVSATDYLLKPFNAGRLDQALARVAERLRPAGLEPHLRTFLETLKSERAYPDRFLVRASSHLYFVRETDIEWIDAADNYVRLHANGTAHFVRDTMKAFIGKLHPDRFLRVHRSVIVNINHVQRLEPHGHGEYVLTMKDGSRVTSSRAYSERLHALLKEPR
jgi:two-component system LytT family response regulator